MARLALGLLALCLLAFDQCTAMKTGGWVRTSEMFTYVARFCFVPTHITDSSKQGQQQGDEGEDGFSAEETGSAMYFDMTFPVNDSLTLLVYPYDEDWEKVYYGHMTCEQKYEVARQRHNNAFRLKESINWKGTETSISTDMTGQKMFNTKGKIVFTASRNRWYYFAIVNCDPQDTAKTERPPSKREGSLNFNYSFHMVNGMDIFQREFSADQMGMLETDIVFFSLYFVVVGLAVFTGRTLQRSKFFHHTVALGLSTILLTWFDLLCAVIHQSVAGRTGNMFETSFFKIMSQIFNQAAVATLLLMCILIAKGWTVVRRKLRARARVRIGVYMSVYVCVALWAILTAEVGYNAGLVIYFYAITPGVVLGCMRAYIMIWFSYATFITFKNYPESNRQKFYLKFYGLFMTWIVALPIQILFAVFVLHNYDRAKFANALERCVTLFAHFAVLVLYNPGTIHQTFSHEISDMEDAVYAESPAEGMAGAGGRPKRSLRAGRRHLTGGLTLGNPITRLKNYVQKLKFKIYELQDHVDNLQSTFVECDFGGDGQDEDFAPRAAEGHELASVGPRNDEAAFTQGNETYTGGTLSSTTFPGIGTRAQPVMGVISS